MSRQEPASPRSIPACAGEPRCRSRRPCYRTVYPRVCGGTPTSICTVRSRNGLSPRVRGNPHLDLHGQVQERSIPACAGEPDRHPRMAEGREVYPRVCGGTCGRVRRGTSFDGLSPRVRGNHQARLRGGLAQGSIPACAGEPLYLALDQIDGQVYPRVCGGTLCRPRRPPWVPGLSPRVRGNRSAGQWRDRGCGSIPACAGEPSAVDGMAFARKVYPRVCGGTTEALASAWPGCGLSPRVRGNL